MPDFSIIALDGVLDSSLAVTLDILAAAQRLAALFGDDRPSAMRLLSAGGKEVRTGSGYAHGVDGSLDGRHAADAVIVLGLNLPVREELEVALEREDVSDVIAFLKKEHKRGAWVTASCSGTFLLAESGLLDGGRATTSWWLAPFFRERYPKIELSADETLVTGPRLITAGAALSQVDLMLNLVRRFYGTSIADLVTRFLILDERTTQARYMVREFFSHDSELVLRAEKYLKRHLGEPLTLEDVARAAKTSPRTLSRRFRSTYGESPLKVLKRLRSERAVHLLMTTKLSVEEVAEKVGYADPGALRRTLKSTQGKTPREIRVQSKRGKGGAGVSS